MTYFTFERHGFHRGEHAFEGDVEIGEVFVRKPLRERLSIDDSPPRYVAKLPSGTWLPGDYADRHEAAEALRAHHRQLLAGRPVGA